MTALFNLVNDSKLHFAPLEQTTADRVLDIGAGTGTWCVDMGDTYPDAEVIGVDISANAPEFVPPNVRFEVDDVEDPWTFSQPFTFIHSRYMAGSIVDWEGLMRQCFDNLKPGGWAEFQDFDIDYYSQDGTLTTEHALRRWLTTAYGAIATTRRTLKPGVQLEDWMRSVGFVNVQVIKTPLPLGPWPKDKRQKRIGLLNWAQLWEGLEGMSLRLFIDILGYSEAQLHVLLAEVRKDLQTPSIHPIFDL
jgi:SAM-dependent methyltransferase